MHTNLQPIPFSAPASTVDPTCIRVLLVDDAAVFRAGLRAILAAEPGLMVVGEAADGRQGVQLARRLRADVVLLALRLPGLDGIAATEQLRAELPTTQVVLLTGVGEDEDTVVAAVRAGAIGYLRKDAAIGQVLEAIRAAAHGQAYLSPQAAARLMREVRSAEAQLSLSQRERDVLRMLGLGSTNKEIGHSLLIAESTVKTHVSAILGKLGAQSRTQAALHAVRLGLVSPGELRAAA